VDHLAEVVASAAGLRADSDEAFAAHYLVRAWKERSFSPEAGALPTEQRFLVDFDLPYRVRRVRFVSRSSASLSDPTTARSALEACPGAVRDVEDQVAAWSPHVPEYRARLGAIAASLTRASQQLSARVPESPISAPVAALGLGWEDLRRALDADDDEAMRHVASELLAADDRFKAVQVIAAAFRTRYRLAAEEAREAVEALLGPHSARREGVSADPADVLRSCLRFHYDAFEAYDTMLLPILFGTPLGETDNVEVVRISPVDASARAAPEERMAPGPYALRGTAVSNFGGFFDRDWRRHDLTWGRLDGSERLIRSFVRDRACADALVDRAHERHGTEVVLRRVALAAPLLLGPLLEVRGIRGGRVSRAVARLAAPLVRRLLDPTVGRLGTVLALLGLAGAAVTIPALVAAGAVLFRLWDDEWTRSTWGVLCLSLGAMFPTFMLAIGVALARRRLFAGAYNVLFGRRRAAGSSSTVP
jgi:hypothetical protein